MDTYRYISNYLIIYFCSFRKILYANLKLLALVIFILLFKDEIIREIKKSDQIYFTQQPFNKGYPPSNRHPPYNRTNSLNVSEINIR